MSGPDCILRAIGKRETASWVLIALRTSKGGKDGKCSWRGTLLKLSA